MKFPAVVQKHLDVEIAKAVAADRATRTAAAPSDVSGKSNAAKPDIRRAIGLRLKSMWMNHPLFAHKTPESAKAWVKKSATAFEGVFGQGGSLLSQEYSSEIIELLRPSTALLQAGARTETYSGKLNIGKLNGGAHAEFVTEGKAPTSSSPDTGSVVLESFKLMGVYEPTMDMLRNPTINSADLLADDLLAAMGVAWDKAALLADGTGPNPLGLLRQVKDSNKVTGVAITQSNKSAVISFVDAFEQRVKSSNLPIEGNKPFWAFSSKVETALKGLYFDNGGWIFRDQLNQGKLNGKPVYVTENYGDNLFVFGLANQIYFGLDQKSGESDGGIILDMAQPQFKEDIMTIKAIMYVDAKLRHNVAMAYADNVTFA